MAQLSREHRNPYSLHHERGEVKKYEKVAADLRAWIRQRPPGTELPTRAELADQHSVALNTIAHALDVLRAEGWIETAQGARTITLAPPQPGMTLEERVARVERRLDQMERRIG